MKPHTTTNAQANLSDAGMWAKTKRSKQAVKDTRTTCTLEAFENQLANSSAETICR